VFRSGRLVEAAPENSEPDRYVYDPLDVRPAELEREERPRTTWRSSGRALNLFGNGLVYHSEPLRGGDRGERRGAAGGLDGH
jgi:hypothetical protein